MQEVPSMPDMNGKAELLDRIEALQRRIAELEKALPGMQRPTTAAGGSETVSTRRPEAAGPARAGRQNAAVIPPGLDESFLATLLDAIPLPVFYKDVEGRYLGFNQAFEAFTGTKRQRAIGKTVFDIHPPALAQVYQARDSELLKSGGLQQFISQAKNARGEIREVLFNKALFKDSQGAVGGVIGTMFDITERKHTEEALRESEERYRTIFRNSPMGIFRSTMEGRLLEVNPAVAEMFGYASPEEVVREVRNIGGQINTGVEYRLRIFSDQVHRAGTTRHLEHFRRRDGSEFIANLYLKTIRDAKNRPLFLEGIIEDITERKKLEDQLRQSQKMEAVGRLAGGVAHDFNNMLGVILGHAELAMELVAPNLPLYHDLEKIREAAGRSAELTRQLLAFARKQTVTPRTLDFNETVGGMLKMLQPLIGEAIDLVWRPLEALPPIKMDPSQIDQILANLCVNARDAITGVGKIIIETGMATFDEADCAVHSELLPGNYIMLVVSDDGRGMDAHTQSKIFEPFFTTKIKGKGTGLGLATIYGIVKQNNGFIDVYSEPGQGSTFKIYLPAQPPESGATDSAGPAAPMAVGHETILLAEDEPTLLEMGRLMLERIGYRVLTAATPGAAIRLAKAHTGEIHLLMTDVVMPEMNGKVLAQKLIRLRPGIKQLFMSGYTGDILDDHGVVNAGVHFIQKPFSLQNLAAKVREALNSEPENG
jgi:PAS domain S-box-containing protein